ncbi:Hypothetical predicted protein [Octopus vulgaris]|uniref:Uncharacterized protein n=1 Tax=Octopus vulgaris TaxID=6645 RepID=A0AA36FDK1_OCTVU|nr:Hypothetical predicted protein [Octopus vulgaris]
MNKDAEDNPRKSKLLINPKIYKNRSVKYCTRHSSVGTRIPFHGLANVVEFKFSGNSIAVTEEVDILTDILHVDIFIIKLSRRINVRPRIQPTNL